LLRLCEHPLMTIIGRFPRVGGDDDLDTYNAPRPLWARYVAVIASTATLVAIFAYLAGGWWRVVTIACLLVLALLVVTGVRWEREHTTGQNSK
jgi:hypothetical protein